MGNKIFLKIRWLGNIAAGLYIPELFRRWMIERRRDEFVGPHTGYYL